MEIHSGPASAYAPHGAALLDYFRNHTSATLSCYQDGGRDDVPGSTVRAISIEGLKSIDPERRMPALGHSCRSSRVSTTSDPPQRADVRPRSGLVRGPLADITATAPGMRWNADAFAEMHRFIAVTACGE
jgi:hypothetical protein